VGGFHGTHSTEAYWVDFMELIQQWVDFMELIQ
jgi:hypothetical protein